MIQPQIDRIDSAFSPTTKTAKTRATAAPDSPPRRTPRTGEPVSRAPRAAPRAPAMVVALGVVADPQRFASRGAKLLAAMSSEDAERLRAMGVAAVYTPKDFELNRIMFDIVGLVDPDAMAGLGLTRIPNDGFVDILVEGELDSPFEPRFRPRNAEVLESALAAQLHELDAQRVEARATTAFVEAPGVGARHTAQGVVHEEQVQQPGDHRGFGRQPGLHEGLVIRCRRYTPRLAGQAELVPGQRQDQHADKPQPQLLQRQSGGIQLPAGHLGPQVIGDGEIHDHRGTGKDQVKMAGHPLGIVDHGIHGVAGVDHATEAAEGEHQHGQYGRGHHGITPGQCAYPAEQSLATAQAARDLERIADMGYDTSKLVKVPQSW